ncbi:hypothetical protein GCM10027449_26060 [Sinomonas notoginsengisoli]|uniref:FtsK/SpoIIIE domain-containing protein n=1 Tax=Sinomonas notoginsengisoli TaxID=1457311 RepID=UPI001F3F08B5|nr:FtsK/SpoIIIE domain-containing protein [Sinomonas notoginsengisoli]
MELHLTLLVPGAYLAADGRLRRELVINAMEGASGADVAAALARELGARACTAEGKRLEHLTVGTAPLSNGAVIVAGGTAHIPQAPPPLCLVVHTGPAAGTVIPLRRGPLRIGRAPDVTTPHAALADPDLSREHAEIEVTDSGIVLRDLGSANGVWAGGRRIERAEMSTGQEFRFGSSTCALTFSDDIPLLDPDAGGGHPSPLRVARHATPARKAAMLTMAVLPLVVGVAMALATGMWMFLAFTAVSAISLLIPLVEGRAARRDFERRLHAAADDDASRRRRLAPDVGVLARAAGVSPRNDPRTASPRPPVGPTEAVTAARAGALATTVMAQERPSPIYLRLGTARESAHVTIEPADRRTVLPVLEAAPLTVRLQGRIAVHGGVADVTGLLHSLMLQLAVLPAAEGLRIVVASGRGETRLAARYLPRVDVVPWGESPKALEARATRGARAVLVLLPDGLPGDADSGTGHWLGSCARAASELEWPVIGPSAALGASPDVLVRLDSTRSVVTINGALTETTPAQPASRQFAPDLVPHAVFEAAARRAGARTEYQADTGIPERCGLEELVALDAAGMSAAWGRSGRERGLPIPLGRSQVGPAVLDLVADGPHVLVAGTTGSGKSELLRSLVAAAAATYAPDRLTFLFLDFKGGSGLEPLAGLPHCVGLVTDLAEGGMDRTLASLRAELKRRERVLQESHTGDVEDYGNRGGLMPRLVLVVDEFRMLVEEAPAALGELMRIATVGRSLGMHLVMATQRPQGAISADIRANVTTSIGLRMQHDAESSDVIGSPLSAHIPVGLPGRAYLSVGGGPPLAFQSASLGLAATSSVQRRVDVADALVWLDRRAESASEVQLSPAQAAAPLVSAAVEAWAQRGGWSVPRPLAPALPNALVWDPAGRPHDEETSEVLLGIVDLPHEQRTTALTWSPARDGHLALIGAASAGTAGTFAAVAAQLAGNAITRHLYILDGDGSLAFLRDHPRVGSYVGVGELRRAARVIARLGEECAERLARTRGEEPDVALVLVVSAWGTWISALRQSPHAWAEEALGGLLRDGAMAALSVLAAGERELVSSRVFGSIPARLFFPLGSTDEARLSWPRLPPMPSLRGRAGAAGTIVEGGPYTAHCYDHSSGSLDASRHLLRGLPRRRSLREPRPFRIDPLPATAPAHAVAALAAVWPATAGVAWEAGQPFGGQGRLSGGRAPRIGAADGGNDRRRLVVGLAGDEAMPLSLRVDRGEVLLALGASCAGKSAFLAALPTMNPGVGFVSVESEERLSRWSSLLEQLTGTGAVPDTGRVPIVLVDDADHLGTEENHLLSQLLDTGASMVATAAYSPNLYARCPLALRVRSAGTGILIGPRTSGDGDVFGVRVDVPGPVPSGRAVALIDGRQVDVQLGCVLTPSQDTVLPDGRGQG